MLISTRRCHVCHSFSVKWIKGRERRGGRGAGPGSGNGWSEGAGGVRSWSSGPSSSTGELPHGRAVAGRGVPGGVSSLKSPAGQGYTAEEGLSVSFKALIPPPLPAMVVLSVPPVPVHVGTHRREGGTWLNIALGILHRGKALW